MSDHHTPLVNEQHDDSLAVGMSNIDGHPSGPPAAPQGSLIPALSPSVLQPGRLVTSISNTEMYVDATSEDDPALKVDMENVALEKQETVGQPEEKTRNMDSAIAGVEERPSKRLRISARQRPPTNVTNPISSSPATASASVESTASHRSKRKSMPPAQTAATSRSRRNVQPATELKPASSVLATFPISPATPPMLGESSLSAPPPSTPPNAARAPEEVYASPHTFFRPPPSAALEIFNRPPSPDIGEIIRAMSGRSTEQHPPISSMSTLPYTSQGSSASGSGLPANGILQPAVNGNANRSQDGIVTQSMSTPVTPRATRLSTTSALTGPQYAVAPADGAMSFAVAGNLSGSPYTVHKTVKLGSKKGKGKATEMGAEQHLANQDFCAACRGIGTFLCCDGCPRSFHFMCLEPPLLANELPEEDEWFCKECEAAQQPSKQRDPPVKGPWAALVKQVDLSNPKQFELPNDIRTYFAGITTRPDGGYGDAMDVKAIKFDRSGFPEDRDVFRLKSKGKTVLCFKCKGSAVPTGSKVQFGLASGRKMLGCDYCNLNWHADCLEPPLMVMPNPQRKWQCPNHAQQVAPKKRTLRRPDDVIIREPGHRNNGNIEIIDQDTRQRLACESLYINGKRYRVPEKVVQVDFWTKIGKLAKPKTPPSTRNQVTAAQLFDSQSPLSTVPSTLADDEDMNVESEADDDHESPPSTTDVAKLLLEFAQSSTSSGPLIESTGTQATADLAIGPITMTSAAPFKNGIPLEFTQGSILEADGLNGPMSPKIASDSSLSQASQMSQIVATPSMIEPTLERSFIQPAVTPTRIKFRIPQPTVN